MYKEGKTSESREIEETEVGIMEAKEGESQSVCSKVQGKLYFLYLRVERFLFWLHSLRMWPSMRQL
jgi:hypothetical protein